jgi:uncharacterized protein with GYD domain
MALYLYQAAYNSESLSAQIANPQDRLEVAGRPAIEAVGGRMVAGGFSFGEYDIAVVYEAPDDVSAAALSVALGAGGAIRAARTTRLLSGAEWVQVLQRATSVSGVYRPALREQEIGSAAEVPE